MIGAMAAFGLSLVASGWNKSGERAAAYTMALYLPDAHRYRWLRKLFVSGVVPLSAEVWVKTEGEFDDAVDKKMGDE